MYLNSLSVLCRSFFLKKQFPHPQKVTEILYPRIHDDKILEYVINSKSTIAMDRKFVVQILNSNQKVICVFHDVTMIQMKKIRKLDEPTHMLTIYLLQNDKIIIP